MRQFFTESVMLAAIGGAFSLVIASFLGKLMLTLMPPGVGAAVLSTGPAARSLAATAAVTLLTAVLFGLYPAWRAARVDAAPALKEDSGSGGTSSRSRWAAAKMLVLVQVSLGVLLVTAAIIFTSHLNQLVSRDTGFERERVLLFDVRPGELGYQGARLRQFYLDLESRLSGLTGIQAVGLARTRPMRGGGYSDGIRIPGQERSFVASIHHGSSSFIAALGIPLLAGRAIAARESRTGAKVAVISEDLVKELRIVSPLGTRLQTGDIDYEVIGVARQARYSHMTRLTPVAYLPFDYTRQSATVVVRTVVSPMVLLGAIRDAIKEMDRDLPLVDIYTMEQQISRTLQRERMFAWLCGSFGILALLLCVVGLYGLISHTAARRTPEIGIRIALGASRGDVLSQVLSEGMRLAGAGILLGAPLAIYGARIAQSQRLIPEGNLPYWTLAASTAALAIAALAAVLGPALRASSVDPIRALRRG
jgi:predicted permease